MAAAAFCSTMTKHVGFWATYSSISVFDTVSNRFLSNSPALRHLCWSYTMKQVRGLPINVIVERRFLEANSNIESEKESLTSTGYNR